MRFARQLKTKVREQDLQIFQDFRISGFPNFSGWFVCFLWPRPRPRPDRGYSYIPGIEANGTRQTIDDLCSVTIEAYMFSSFGIELSTLKTLTWYPTLARGMPGGDSLPNAALGPIGPETNNDFVGIRIEACMFSVIAI